MLEWRNWDYYNRDIIYCKYKLYIKKQSEVKFPSELI